MNERELLERAAKAAGFERIEWVIDAEHVERAHCWNGVSCVEWNPLTDDGDAFRLAVGAGIDVYWCAEEVQCGDPKQGEYLRERFGMDRQAATRRAIVRAAAADRANHI